MGGVNDGRAAPEKTVYLQGIQAPKFARGRKGTVKEEEWAWHSREFLRRRVIGQKVSFVVVSSTAGKSDKGKGENEKGGKEKETKTDKRPPLDYCTVTLISENLNLSKLMVQSGWAKVKVSTKEMTDKDGNPYQPKPNSEKQELIHLETNAASHKLGIWSTETGLGPTRSIEWNPDARAIFQKYKNVPLPAVVDFVRDGSTLRCELLGLDDTDLHHTMIMLHLAGIQCPRTPIPDKDVEQKTEKKRGPIDPLALEAQQFTAARLLHRDVQVLIQGVDKFNNFFGTILFPKGNITLKLLEHGLASVLSWSAAITPDAARIKEAERQAKQAKLGIWANYSGSIDEKDVHREISGKVTEVLSGDSIKVKVDDEAVEKQFYFASIRAPRFFGANSEAFGFEAREFVRKRLIGHPIKLLVEYVKVEKQSGRRQPPKKRNNKATEEATEEEETAEESSEANGSGSDEKSIERAYVSVGVGQSNLSMMLLQNGLATVIRHRLEEDRSMFYEDYQKAEEQAVVERRGMHQPGVHMPRQIHDLTQRGRVHEARQAKSKPIPEPLQRDKGFHYAIVERVFSGSRFKLFIPSRDYMIFFALSGVKLPGRNENQKLLKFGHEAELIALNALLHQNVQIEITDLVGDNFLGNLWIGKENLALKFIQDGLARVLDRGQNNGPYFQEFSKAEEVAKAAKLNIWSIEDETAARQRKAQQEEEEFKEETLEIKITDFVNGSTFWFQVVPDPVADEIAAAMKSFDADNAPDVETPKRDSVVACLFTDNEWHRVRLNGRTKENDQHVFFLDYGNTDVVSRSNLKQLPENLASLPGRARKAGLACIVAAPSTKENGQNALRELTALVWGRPVTAELKAIFDGKTLVTLTSTITTTPKPAEPNEDGTEPEEQPEAVETTVNVNESLLSNGWVRVAKENPQRLAALLEESNKWQAAAKADHKGIWEHGDAGDDDEEEQQDDQKPRGRGRKGGANGQNKRRQQE